MCQWNEVKSKVEPDGSLRDIYVFGIDETMWDKFLTEIALSKYSIEFTHGGDLVQLPPNLASIKMLQESDPTILSIFASHLRINCHFFITSEIEMDISPEDLNSESDFDLLIEFLKWLSKLTNSKVVLTHENSQDDVILTVCL